MFFYTYGDMAIAQLTFFFLHWIKGNPDAASQGNYNGLTLWEQIDAGTPWWVVQCACAASLPDFMVYDWVSFVSPHYDSVHIPTARVLLHSCTTSIAEGCHFFYSLIWRIYVYVYCLCISRTRTKKILMLVPTLMYGYSYSFQWLYLTVISVVLVVSPCSASSSSSSSVLWSRCTSRTTSPSTYLWTLAFSWCRYSQRFQRCVICC